MILTKIKKVYISGIGGIGTSALAQYFVAKGIEVLGSDLEKSEITQMLEDKGIQIYYSQEAKNITDDIDLLIYSAAVPEKNPERMAAHDFGIEQKSYFEYLGYLSKEYKTIAVSGTHGKSTTTAMLASVLTDCNLDPNVIVGTKIKKFNSNYRYGRSNLLVLEACEYRAHMLLLQPWSIILTNIEEDHLDYYKDINHIKQTFQQYINNLHKDCLLIVNSDDPNIQDLTLPDCKIVKFGFGDEADLQAYNLKKEPGQQTFSLKYLGKELGDFILKMPGDYNVYNALGVVAYGLLTGLTIGQIKKSLAEFDGIWRRFEIVRDDDITVVADYAHHPTALKGLIKSAREFYPDRRLVIVYQPHQHDRTRKLFNEFIDAFDEADKVLLAEIYDVAGRNEEADRVNSEMLVEKIKEHNPNLDIEYSGNIEETLTMVNQIKKTRDVIFVVGAGDIYNITKEI